MTPEETLQLFLQPNLLTGEEIESEETLGAYLAKPSSNPEWLLVLMECCI